MRRFESFYVNYEDLLTNEKLNKNNDLTFEFYEWFVGDGCWVEVNQPLCEVKFLSQKEISYVIIFSKKSGYFESKIEKKVENSDEIRQGELFYRIHSDGSYVNQNSPDKESFSMYFSEYKYFDYSPEQARRKMFISIFLVNDGDYVSKGDKILKLVKYNPDDDDDDDDNEVEVFHFAEKNGYIDLYYTNKHGIIKDLENGQHIYTINENDQLRINRKFSNIPIINYDIFKKSKNITWKHVGGYEKDGVVTFPDNNNFGYVVIGFNFLDNKDNLILQYNYKNFTLNVGDTFSFLFDNNIVIDFIIEKNSFKVPNTTLKQNNIVVTKEELEIFQNNDMLKWRICIEKEGIEIHGGSIGYYNYIDEKNLRIIIRNLVKEYNSVVNQEIANYSPIIRRDEIDSFKNINNDYCYVYLMIDSTNGYYKIGLSNNPNWREKTLQGEKPTIELLGSKKFINRKIASSFEKALHDTYADKRIRGEWFELGLNDVEEIVYTLKG